VGRWAAVILAVLAAAGAGLLAGYVHWGLPRAPVESVEPRRRSDDIELEALRAQNRQLQSQLQQVTREQERLAQENELLRKQRATEQLLATPGELPVLPPK